MIFVILIAYIIVLLLKWHCIWWIVCYDLFRTQNPKFRTWGLSVLTWDLTWDLSVLIWVLIWDLGAKTWDLLLLAKQWLGPTSACYWIEYLLFLTEKDQLGLFGLSYTEQVQLRGHLGTGPEPAEGITRVGKGLL